MERKTIYLGLGSNAGNREENIKRAIEHLSLALGSPTALSTIIESEPWGYDSQNSYLNCVVAFETTLAPLQLLDTTEAIERTLGRTQKSIGGVYSDRTMDIDILFYGNDTVAHPHLTVPHPLLHERLFVLAPLNEIAPTLQHPQLGKSVQQLLGELKE